MRGTMPVVQVLLLREPEVHWEMGESLLAAFKEVEAFYNYDTQRAVFERVDLSEPRARTMESTGGVQGTSPSGAWDTEDLWGRATGKYSRMFDQRKLCDLVREQLTAQGKHGPQVIVTDWEITPPPNWRYIIWDGCPEGGVVSVAPTDPHYWRRDDPHRIARIKHRVRTACLCLVGQFLGLGRCRNERCFLYANVDSVVRLDTMVYLGTEHKLPELARRGFPILTDNPKRVQSIEYDPQADGE